MGVYIKGMEMPKECWKCRFDVRGYCVASGRMDNRTRFVDDAPKKAWCPFIPVPPHGRLIDADVLMELYSDTDDLRLKDMKVPIAVIRQNIMDMPTIIPASEEETE